DRLDLAGLFQFLKRPEATAAIQLVQAGCHALLGPKIPEVQVVDQERVDAVQAKPRQAVLVGSEDAVAGVVEAHLQWESAGPATAVVVGRIAWADQDSPDLRAQHEAVPRLSLEHAPHAVLALAGPVPRRGVEVADASRVGGLDRQN